MPSSWLTLILTLDVPLLLRGSVRVQEPNGPAWDAAPGETFTSCVGGLHDRAAVEMSGRQTGVQLSVDPLAAHRLLGSPAAASCGSGSSTTRTSGTRCEPRSHTPGD